MFLKKSDKGKIAQEWTSWDLGLQFCGNRPKLKKRIKKLSSKKVRKYLMEIV